MSDDGSHDRTPGLWLLILATTVYSVIAIYLYLKTNERPGKYKLKPMSTPTRSAVNGVRG